MDKTYHWFIQYIYLRKTLQKVSKNLMIEKLWTRYGGKPAERGAEKGYNIVHS
jgi:hypothetical protein